MRLLLLTLPILLITAVILSLQACQTHSSTATQNATLQSQEPGTANGQEASTQWTTAPTPKDFDRSRTLRAGFLIVDGVFNSELTAPYDIFHHTPFHTGDDPGIEVFTVSPNGRAVTTFEGLVLQPHYSFNTAPPIDILVVPSAENSMTTDLDNAEMMDWVKSTGEKADFILSLCDGAFVLAAAGLLDGRAATTFPGDQDRFAEQFPALDLRRGVDFVHDRNAITSEGGAKSFTPAMYLVAHLYGDEVAASVGTGLILDWPPTPRGVSGLVRTPTAQ